MRLFPSYFRTLLVTIVTATVAAPALSVSAAIPCQELPVIEADPNMPIPMIYIELPVTLEAAFERRGWIEDERASELAEDDASGVTSAAENQFRCLGYGMDIAFLGNSTPEQRVIMVARPDIEPDIEKYIEVDSLYTAYLGDPVGLEDGRVLIDFAIIVNGDHYLQGELVFTEFDDMYYLDASRLSGDVVVLAEPTVVELSTTFTREVKIINVTDGDKVVFDNQEQEASAKIVITSTDGDTIFEGFAGGTTLIGGENSNIFVVHGLEPGDYQIEVTFSPDDVKFSATLVVGDGDDATPVASPESTPQS